MTASSDGPAATRVRRHTRMLDAAALLLIVSGAAVYLYAHYRMGELAAGRMPYTRMTKSGPRTFDVREAVVAAEVEPIGTSLHVSRTAASSHGGGGVCAILRLVVQHTTPAVRPDDVLTALREIADLQPPRPPLVTRLAQGPLNTATARVADPLAADEKVDGT